MADIPSWPERLPMPRASGYGIEPVTPYSRTDMDNGSAQQRRRFTSAPAHVSVTFMLSISEYAVFEGFVKYEIGLGTDRFQVPLLNGLGVNTVSARFMDSPPYKSSLSDSRTYWTVTATLEVRALPIVSRDQYDLMRVLTDGDIFKFSDTLHDLVNVQFPTVEGPL